MRDTHNELGFCCYVQVSVDVPDQKGRLEILNVHARNKKLGEDVDLKEVASRCPGFTGADLANLLNEVNTHPPPRCLSTPMRTHCRLVCFLNRCFV